MSTTTVKEAPVAATLAQLSGNQQPGEVTTPKKRARRKATKKVVVAVASSRKPKRLKVVKVRTMVTAPRGGSKKAQVIAMLKRPHGAALDTIMSKTGWQAHTTRGFISILGRSERVKSVRNNKGQRVYRIA